MNKKILISIAAVIIALSAVSMFVNSFQSTSGKIVAPIATNFYIALTVLILIAVSALMVIKK